MIYLDNAATTKPFDKVSEIYADCAADFGRCMAAVSGFVRIKTDVVPHPANQRNNVKNPPALSEFRYTQTGCILPSVNPFFLH